MAHILIVDDSPADLKFMESILTGQHAVTAVNDPMTVEARALAARPDLVLLDVVMPERNGYEVLRALKRQSGTQNLKVIFVSSKGADTDVKWGLRQGAVDYLVKPYTPEQVLQTVARHL